jgi:hypothetical protein
MAYPYYLTAKSIEDRESRLPASCRLLHTWATHLVWPKTRRPTMNKRIHVLTCVVVILLGTLGMVTPSQSQTGVKPEPTKKVLLKIIFPDEEWVQAGATEGSLIRIERSGKILGLTPSVRDANKGIVEVIVSKIQRQNGSDSLQEIARVSISGKLGTANIEAPSFKIQLISIGNAPEGISTQGMRFQPAKYSPSSLTVAAMLPDRCCVSCGGTTACADCGVYMSCGSCCTGVCCYNWD